MICMIEDNNTNCYNKFKKKKKGRTEWSGILLEKITGFPLEGVDPVTEIWK